MERKKKKEKASNIVVALQAWLKNAKKIVVAGIGNPLRRDDFVGMKIVRDVKDKFRKREKTLFIECETVPENFIQQIEEFKPTHVLVIDAAIIDEPAGSVRLVEKLGATAPPVSTHMLPLQIFCEYLRHSLGAKVALLAIQPKETSFGEGLTREVAETAQTLTEILAKVLRLT